MRLFFISVYSLLGTVLWSQNITNKQKQVYLAQKQQQQTTLKLDIDKLAAAIDTSTILTVEADTFKVHDIADPDRLLGFVIEQKFTLNKHLVKAVITDYDGEERSFYFKDSLLVKVTFVNKKNRISKDYYFSKEDNQESLGLIYRLKQIIPELEDFFGALSLGRSYLSD